MGDIGRRRLLHRNIGRVPEGTGHLKKKERKGIGRVEMSDVIQIRGSEVRAETWKETVSHSEKVRVEVLWAGSGYCEGSNGRRGVIDRRVHP